jgi:hypothetical protein
MTLGYAKDLVADAWRIPVGFGHVTYIPILPLEADMHGFRGTATRT